MDTGVFLATKRRKNWDEGASERKGALSSLEISEMEMLFSGLNIQEEETNSVFFSRPVPCGKSHTKVLLQSE